MSLTYMLFGWLIRWWRRLNPPTLEQDILRIRRKGLPVDKNMTPQEVAEMAALAVVLSRITDRDPIPPDLNDRANDLLEADGWLRSL